MVSIGRMFLEFVMVKMLLVLGSEFAISLQSMFLSSDFPSRLESRSLTLNIVFGVCSKLRSSTNQTKMRENTHGNVSAGNSYRVPDRRKQLKKNHSS